MYIQIMHIVDLTQENQPTHKGKDVEKPATLIN